MSCSVAVIRLRVLKARHKGLNIQQIIERNGDRQIIVLVSKLIIKGSSLLFALALLVKVTQKRKDRLIDLFKKYKTPLSI